MVETLLKKKDDRYDIYFYDCVYSRRFKDYFVNLKENISEDHIGMYNQEIISQSCMVNDKLVGLVNIYFRYLLILIISYIIFS